MTMEGQNFGLYSGTDRVLRVRISGLDSKDDVASAEFKMGDQKGLVLSKTMVDGSITVIDLDDDTEGYKIAALVSLVIIDTKNLAGLYDYNIVVVDTGPHEDVVTAGRVLVTKQLPDA